MAGGGSNYNYQNAPSFGGFNSGTFQTGGGFGGGIIPASTAPTQPAPQPPSQVNTGNFIVETPSGIGTSTNLAPEASKMITDAGATVIPPISSTISDPINTQPVATQPVTTQPVATQPVTTQPVNTAPMSSFPDQPQRNILQELSQVLSSRFQPGGYDRPAMYSNQGYGYNQPSYGFNRPSPYGGGGFGLGSIGSPFSSMYGGYREPYYGSIGMPQRGYQTPYSTYNYGDMGSFSMPRNPTSADLDQTNRNYAQSFNAFRGMGGTEEEFIDSNQFKDFEMQSRRAAEGGLYAPSARRLSSAIQRRLNILNRSPRRQQSFDFDQSGVPINYGSSMFSRVPAYYERPYQAPYRYGVGSGDQRFVSGLDSIDNTVTGGGVDDQSVQDTGKTSQEIADEVAATGGNLFGVDGLVRNPDGTYTYMPTNQEMAAFFPAGGVTLPESFDVTQLAGYDAAQAEEETTEETTDTGGPDVDTSASDGTVDLTSFGDDNLSLTQQFSKEAAAFEGGESAFVNSPRFMEFEGALIRQYINKSPEEVRAEATRQLERANAGGVYAPSAERIYNSLNDYATSQGA